jgi:chloride channel protein, CIC family
VLGAGYDAIDQAMHEAFDWRVLAALCILKLLATTTSFVTGTPGGLFAPTLFMGAMLGAAVCGVERQIAPGMAGPMGAYALIGMGTTFAGILRAPMTSVFMIVEVSGNYSIILPVMISNTLAYLVSRQFQRHPLFDVLGRQDGTDLPSMEEEREAEVHTVEDAMRSVDGVMLDGEEPTAQAIARAGQVSTEYFLVRLGAGAWGGVSRARLLEMRDNGQLASPLASTVEPIARPYLYPDQSVESALRALQERPFLPVVHRADPTLVVGMLALDDVLRLYRVNNGRFHPAASH